MLPYFSFIVDGYTGHNNIKPISFAGKTGATGATGQTGEFGSTGSTGELVLLMEPNDQLYQGIYYAVQLNLNGSNTVSVTPRYITNNYAEL